MKQQRQRGKKTVQPHTITKAVTHIRLLEANPGKFAALNALAAVYLALCQQYVTCFCTQEPPDAFRDTLFVTPLSERWHRVAIQQAAGIAQSWRTNRANAYQEYLDDLLDSHEQQTFCCVVCGFQTHADLNAATNIERRVGDLELQACKDRKAVKSLLMQRHEAWRQQHGWP